MVSRRINLPEYLDDRATKLANRHGIKTEEELRSLIERGLNPSPYEGKHLAIWAISCLFTAWLVAVFLRAVPLPDVPIQSGPTAPEVHWFREVLQLLLPWPVTIMVVVYFVFGSPWGLSNLVAIFSLFRKVKLFGAEFELNERVKAKVESAANDISEILHDYKTRVDAETARLVAQYQISRKLGSFADEHFIKKFGRERVGRDFRCTIHIADPINEANLYQLVDYHPGGGGAGRTFSERFGIIGKVWRSGETFVVGELLKDGGANLTEEQKIARIIEDWGMNRAEAERALERPSYACMLLEDKDGAKIGTLYLDSKITKAFTLENESEDKIRNSFEEKGTELVESVAKVVDGLSSLRLRVDTSFR
jgi:hypothetical protein